MTFYTENGPKKATALSTKPRDYNCKTDNVHALRVYKQKCVCPSPKGHQQQPQNRKHEHKGSLVVIKQGIRWQQEQYPF